MQYGYNAASDLTSVTDSNGITLFQYDNRDRVTTQIDPDGQTITYAYDLVGNLISLTTSAGTTAYTYDALNRLATATAQGGGVTTYNYDAAGNLIRTQSPDGVIETRTYDTKNQLVSIKDVGPGGAVIASYAYTLDAAGKVISETDGDGRKVVYSYDAAGRLVGETDLNPDGSQRTVEYTYDPDGNRIRQIDSATGTTTSTYDANNRLVSLRPPTARRRPTPTTPTATCSNNALMRRISPRTSGMPRANWSGPTSRNQESPLTSSTAMTPSEIGSPRS